MASSALALTTDVVFDWRSKFTVGGEALHLQLNAISAFFLMLLGVVGGAATVYALEYWSDTAHPRSALSGRVWWSVMLLSLGWVLLASNGLHHVWNHGLLNALLFLGAGSVLHATGTREMSRLGELWRTMPWTTGLFALGAVAISGLPPLNGFVSEWLIYLGLFDATLSRGPAAWWLWLRVQGHALTWACGIRNPRPGCNTRRDRSPASSPSGSFHFTPRAPRAALKCCPRRWRVFRSTRRRRCWSASSSPRAAWSYGVARSLQHGRAVVCALPSHRPCGVDRFLLARRWVMITEQLCLPKVSTQPSPPLCT